MGATKITYLSELESKARTLKKKTAIAKAIDTWADQNPHIGQASEQELEVAEYRVRFTYTRANDQAEILALFKA